MCELLAMSANTPTSIRFSFTGLVERGGRTAHHGDGWGIGFYEGRRCRLFHDPVSSYRSEVARFVRECGIKSEIVISHIRKANRGRVSLANTHPFERELWGRSFVFAHNGQLKGIKRRPLRHYRPMGTTDSEHAFCWLMDRIRERFPRPPQRPAPLRHLIRECCEDLAGLGTFNMLFSDARELYVYCSTRLCWLTRRAPFGRASLRDAEVQVDFGLETTPDDVVTVIATEPLTVDETWNPMAHGELLVFRDGEVVLRNAGA
ncbi:class II glutamine amidotransferase [Arhodomonas sp. SL1]|uniref:class II glutamine amidotransferase n=1 Tax=Arhodomonas sp. SL1 TaxID=3425691 RepID=UPI003F881ECE